MTKRKAMIIVGSTIAVAVVLLVLIAIGVMEHRNVTPISERIEYYKLYADLAKAVLVGFGTALLAILIPAILAEDRFRFERLKGARTAYSEAKTGVDYLPIRISTLDIKAAAALVQRIHVRKHEAELYPEISGFLERRGIDKSPDKWGDNLYHRLYLVKTLLEDNAGKWDTWTPDQRLKEIWKVLVRPKEGTLVDGAVDAAQLALDKSRAPQDDPKPASAKGDH